MVNKVVILLLFICSFISANAQTNGNRSFKIDTFTEFPEEIEGGRCCFYVNENDKEDGQYLMVNDMAATTVIMVNGKKQVLKATKKSLKSKDLIQTYTNKDYILEVQVNSIFDQKRESYSFRGWMTMRSKRGKIEKSIAFIGTCEW